MREAKSRKPAISRTQQKGFKLQGIEDTHTSRLPSLMTSPATTDRFLTWGEAATTPELAVSTARPGHHKEDSEISVSGGSLKRGDSRTSSHMHARATWM